MIAWRKYLSRFQRRRRIGKIHRKISHSLLRWTLLYIREFCEETTIQGFRFLAHPKYHPLEIFFWGVVIVLATIGATMVVNGSWERYQANPTVVSLEKNYRKWITPFPSFSICFIENVNVTRAEEMIKRLWGEVDKEKKEYYMTFLNTIANASLGNLHEFEQYENDSTLEKVNLKDVVYEVQIDFKADINGKTNHSKVIRQTLTEAGLCYTWGSRIAHHFSLRKKKSWPSLITPCNYVDLPCSVRVSELPVNVKFYVISPDETPIEGKSKPHPVSRGLDRDIFVAHRQTVASPELRKLYPEQRRCRFQDEVLNNGPPVYSHHICKMGCRKEMSIQYCGCVPFFYSAFAKERETICNTKGMACLAKYKDNIIEEVFRNEERCPCYQKCDHTEFSIENENNFEIESRYDELTKQVRFSIGIEHYSRTRHKRDVIFSYEDLVVSFGGTISLFLGCSILSCVELVYFFTLRLICKLWMQYKTNNNNRLQPKRITSSDLKSTSQ